MLLCWWVLALAPASSTPLASRNGNSNYLVSSCIKDPDCKNDCVVYTKLVTVTLAFSTCLPIFLHLVLLPLSLPSSPLLTLFTASVFPSYSSSSFSSSSSRFIFMFPILYFGGGVVSLCPPFITYVLHSQPVKKHPCKGVQY